MICFDTDNGRFNLRSAAVVIHDDRVLIHRAIKDDFWALPGGRVNFFETSEETVRREIFEELGLECNVERHLWHVENFFTLDNIQFHELANYFLVSLNHPSDIASEVNFNGIETSVDLIFRWIPLGSLEAYNLKPNFLTDKLCNLPNSVEFIQINELNV